jgi:predicted dehydrogenase
MSKRPHVLIVGVGSIGERHLRCFQSTDRCTLAFCEPLEERRQQVASRYQVKGYPGWQEALDNEDFTTAVIASPAPWHIPLAEALTQRGLDLLIEKPLSLNFEGVNRLVTTVAERRTHVAVGFNLRAIPALQQIRAAVQSGQFGRIVQVQVQSGQHFPFYRPAYREIYYADPSQGGGLIQDGLPHYLNAVEWIAGPTTKVVTDAAHQVLAGVTVEDSVNVLSRHAEVMGSFSVNQHQPVNELTITVLCEQGAARWDINGQKWMTATECGGQWQEVESYHHQRDDYYIMQANAFFDFVAGQSGPLCSLAEGITTLRSMLAVLRSRETGGWVSVDPIGKDAAAEQR